MAQARAADAGDFRLRRRCGMALGGLIGFEPGESRSGEVGVAFRDLTDELEEQRQRPRRARLSAFMLRRTMLR